MWCKTAPCTTCMYVRRFISNVVSGRLALVVMGEPSLRSSIINEILGEPILPNMKDPGECWRKIVFTYGQTRTVSEHVDGESVQPPQRRARWSQCSKHWASCPLKLASECDSSPWVWSLLANRQHWFVCVLVLSPVHRLFTSTQHWMFTNTQH